MKPLTRLDYAIFQLTPTRTRCELYVSAGGKTEKLAAGLLNPFLQHLRTAEEQVARGGYSIRLEPPDPNVAAWFTKGTMERFVRFVSTPEVLERVSIVEMELTQLEETISAQVTEPSQVDDQSPQNAGPPSLTGAKSMAATSTEKTALATKTRQNSMDSIDIGVPENSKKRLLRALDARRMVLQKEQGMAFARAAAAGFNTENIADLVVFAEFFGATRLREACMKFMMLCKKRQEAGLWLEEMDLPTVEVASTRSDMSYMGIASETVLGSYAKPRDYPDAWSDIDGGDMKLDELRDDSETGRTAVVGHPVLPAWQGQPQQFVQNAYPPYGATYSSPQKHLEPSHVLGGSGRGPHSSGFQYNPHYLATPFLPNSTYSDQNSGSPWRRAETSPKTGNTQSEDEVADQEITDKEELSPSETSRRLPRRSSSPRNRSPSPHRRVQIGRSGPRRTGVVVIRNINYIASNSQDNPNKDREEGDYSSASGSEESDSELSKTEGTTADSVRVSVQDVIGLFENKRKNASDSKKKSSKQDHSKGSVGSVRSSKKMVLRKWTNTADDSTLESNAEHEEEESDPMSQTSQKHMLQDEASEFKDDAESDFKPLTGEERVLLSHRRRQSSQRSTDIAEFESEAGKNRKISTQHRHGGLESSQMTQEVLTSERDGTGSRSANFNGSDVLAEQQGPPSQVRPTIDDSMVISGGAGQRERSLGWKNRIPDQDLEVVASQYDHGFAEQQLLDKMSVDDSFIVPARDIMDHEQATKSWRTTINMESEMATGKNLEKQFATSGSEMLMSFEPNDLLMVPERNTESVGKSWNNGADYDMELLVNKGHSKLYDDNQQSVVEKSKSSKEQTGGFYEQYKEKREAKLRGEPGSKRTERTSKLKVMQEMLEKRKSDLAKNSKSQKASPLVEAQLRAEKLRAYKADLQKSKKEKEEEDRRRLEEMKIKRRERIAARSSPGSLHTQSASSTPRGSRSQMGAIRHGLVSKLPPSSQKSAVSTTSMPHSSVRGSSFLSRGATVKGSNLIGVPPSSRKSAIAKMQANAVGSPLSRSLPSLTELRRESNRSSSVRSSIGSQRTSQAKNSGQAGNPKFVKEISTIPSNAVVGERKRQGSIVKKSIGTFAIPKGEGFLSVKHTKDLPNSGKQPKGSKIVEQDVKPFLKRSGNTGRGTGGGTSKQKIINDEKRTVAQQAVSPLPKPEAEEMNGVKAVMVPETVEEAQPTFPDEAATEPGYIPDRAPASCVSESRVPIDEASSDCIEVTEVVEVSKNSQREVSDINSMQFLHDSKLKENRASDLVNSRSTQTQSGEDTLAPHESSIALMAEPAPDESVTEVNVYSAPFPSHVSPELHGSGVPGEQYTTPVAPAMVSPVSGPSARSLPQLHQLLSQTEDSRKSEPTKSRKKWGSAEKPYSAGSEVVPKEAAKGLKRLLKFAKKSSGNTGHNSSDWVSASATLEGDKEGHERRNLGFRSMDDLGSKAHSVSKGSNLKWSSNGRSHDPGFVTDSKVYERGSVNPVRSSVLPNSRLREDHLSGGSSVKASRSFFSLSSFRSKGGEGKS